MEIPDPVTVHLGTAWPREQFLALYREEDPDLNELIFAVPDHDAGDLVAWVVPGDVPAILNTEVFAGQDSDCEVEDSAGWNLRGVAIVGVERRLGHKLPRPPATLDRGLSKSFLDAYEAERESPTPWYVFDATGCWDAVVDRTREARYEWRCECCRQLFEQVPLAQARAVLQPHATNESFRGFMVLCANCHAMAHDPFTESMAELVMAHRSPCPQCDRHTVAYLMFGMPPGPQPGVLSMNCVLAGEPVEQMNSRCITCGHTWFDESPREEAEEDFEF
ncbi:hypothetical protein [Rhodococcoides kyotonense]|uniref:Uncharacterized protein n=1 Tax=Rhodococcoides kyotonense TaxID=398843 RepID=A0A177YE29_9NOCA|nr:hypothetical protein [Rhodococcus kyotonensis]OAK53806.1 hypothetical protein A3K89_22050 [Rhodococcus kyotonensis]